MTLVEHEKVRCECGNIVTVPVHRTANVTNDPKLKDKVFRGEINLGACSRCGREHQVILPFLYHDMDLKLMAWVLPDSWEGEKESGAIKEKFIKDLHTEFKTPPMSIPTGYVFDAVFGTKELRDKLERLERLRRH